MPLERVFRSSSALACALEDLLEALVALWDLLASVGAGERRDEHADTVALEVELERQFRPRAAVEWCDGDGPDRADGTVDTSERARVWRIMLCDLVGDLTGAAGQP